MIHDLAERGVGVRNLADPIKVDSANPDDPIGQLAVVMLALFAQMKRTYSLERAAGARAAAAAKGRRIGRPSVVDADKLSYAAHLRDTGSTIAEIVAKTGITRTSLYRHLPPRPAPPVTAADTNVPSRTEPSAKTRTEHRAEAVLDVRRPGGMLESITWPADYARRVQPASHRPAACARPGPGSTARSSSSPSPSPADTRWTRTQPHCRPTHLAGYRRANTDRNAMYRVIGRYQVLSGSGDRHDSRAERAATVSGCSSPSSRMLSASTASSREIASPVCPADQYEAARFARAVRVSG